MAFTKMICLFLFAVLSSAFVSLAAASTDYDGLKTTVSADSKIKKRPGVVSPQVPAKASSTHSPIQSVSDATHLSLNQSLLMNVDSDNSTDHALWNLGATFGIWMHKPYVSTFVVPLALGLIGAFASIAIVCSIRACARSHARARRRRRIRNLADELKTDRTMLLAESSDDDF